MHRIALGSGQWADPDTSKFGQEPAPDTDCSMPQTIIAAVETSLCTFHAYNCCWKPVGKLVYLLRVFILSELWDQGFYISSVKTDQPNTQNCTPRRVTAADEATSRDQR